MENLKKNVSGILLCLFEIVVGILLLFDPVGFTTGIIKIVGILLLIIGITQVIKYFRTEAEEAVTGQYLVKGLIALLTGAFCTFKSQWFIVTFPALTIIYGVVVLVTGLGKVQFAADMIRRKSKKWFIVAISAVLSIVCAVIILNDPFTTTAVLWAFTGTVLIVESVIDLVALILSSKESKSEQ